MSLYGDNYFDLLPGKQRSISLELAFAENIASPVQGRLILEGSNVAPSEIPITVNIEREKEADEMKGLVKGHVLWLSALLALWPGALAGAEQVKDFGGMSGSTELLLSGGDWKLGSFPMGAGEEHKGFDAAFDDSSFRSVPVPAEIQLTLGLEGMALYRQSKELTLIHKQEWWYRKRFTLPKEHAGKSVWLVFEGSDYFTTVWLNGEKLGSHEGAYTAFSFDITS